MVIAFRGTNDFLDVIQDIYLALNRANARQQLAPAQTFVRRVASKYGGSYKISLTGHSLGGWLAQYMVYRIKKHGIIDDRIQCRGI
ncbi:lipase family protein [Paenibacillus alvei]|uniref:lipase family protein n=1 Tax=Paenibacillus alvei TaxID=44250 RepID=UPI0039901F05